MKARNKLEDMGIDIKPSVKEMQYRPKEEAAPAIDEFDFRPGDRVRHRKFGDGTVVSSQAFGRDAIVVIDFDTAGNKRLMAAFAKLERIK